MKCYTCAEEKLSKEFMFENLSASCKHEPFFCMQCALNVRNTGKCPYKGCNCDVPRNGEKLDLYDAILRSMYPEFIHMLDESDGKEKSPVATGGTQAGASDGIISVSLLTGESYFFKLLPSMTVMNLKQGISQKQGTPVGKQKLVYNETELETRKADGNLAMLKHYGVKTNSKISLLVMLYAIPDNFNQVTFDLYWGYPRRRKDYLDASCLVFNGMNFLYYVDFHQRRNYKGSPITHSGDVMDDFQRTGHHTINVKLQELPSNVTHLFFTLSAWESPVIKHFRKPSLRFFETTKKDKDLCSTSFHHALNSQAVVMCSVSKRSGAWEIYRSGALSAGNANKYGPLINTIRSLIASGV